MSSPVSSTPAPLGLRNPGKESRILRILFGTRRARLTRRLEKLQEKVRRLDKSIARAESEHEDDKYALRAESVLDELKDCRDNYLQQITRVQSELNRV